MSKTAMQEFKAIIELYPNNDSRENLLKWIDKFGFAKEKEQIERAFKNPYRLARVHPGNNMNKDWENYFNQTYQQQKEKQ
jgi:dissimilatory sulfite reductase (desulfoviridin) alpha/beta subunit